ncbi:MAG: helix-turn-helix domain-containing protein [Bacteroidota bacterium]
MTDFKLQYRIEGKGKKLHELRVNGAKSKKEASITFSQQAPENAILVKIDEVKPKEPVSLSDRRMIIHNSFDQFIHDSLIAIGQTNERLIKHAGIHRPAWIKLRKNPENLYFKHIQKIAEFLELPLSEVTNRIEACLKEKKG